MEQAESDLLFIDVDASMPVVKQEHEEVPDYESKRRRFPSATQLKVLLERLEKNPDLARGSLRTLPDRQRARRFWEQIRLRLNTIEGTRKSSNQWMKYWTDKKIFVKKKAAQGEFPLSEIEETIYYLGGGGTYRKAIRSAKKIDSDNEISQEGFVVPKSTLREDAVATRNTDLRAHDRLTDPISADSADNNKCSNSKCQSQAASQFDRILKVEEQRLSMEQSNAQLMRTILQQSAQREQTVLDAVRNLEDRMNERNERDSMMAGALKTLGEGLLALSNAINSNHQKIK